MVQFAYWLPPLINQPIVKVQPAVTGSPDGRWNLLSQDASSSAQQERPEALWPPWVKREVKSRTKHISITAYQIRIYILLYDANCGC